MSGVSVEVKPEHISSATAASSSQQSHNTLTSHITAGAIGGVQDNSFLSSFVPAADKSLMDTSDLSLGGPQEQYEMPSLYEFLVDLFGEKLVQRLTAHVKNLSVGREKRPSTRAEVSAKELSRTAADEGKRASRREESLVYFLKREGFRLYKVQLPLKRMPQKPPAFHPWGRQLWRFQIPTALLPVRTNVLEQWSQGTWGRQRRGGAATVPKCFRRRPFIKRIRHTHTFDIGAIWL